MYRIDQSLDLPMTLPYIHTTSTLTSTYMYVHAQAIHYILYIGHDIRTSNATTISGSDIASGILLVVLSCNKLLVFWYEPSSP